MAKTKWPKLPRFFVPLFHCANIYLCVTKDEWQQALSSLNQPEQNLFFSNGRTMHFCNEATAENLYLVGVFDGSMATLVHECAHATFYCCSDVGVSIKTDEPNETFCYLLDRMFTAFAPYIKQEAK